MTVEALIATLRDFPQDAQVVFEVQDRHLHVYAHPIDCVAPPNVPGGAVILVGDTA